MIRKFLSLFLGMIVSGSSVFAAGTYQNWYNFKLKKSTVQPFKGPFDAESVIYYIVHHGGDLKLNIGFDRWRFEPPKQAVTLPQVMFFQVYDADENLVKKEFHVFPMDHKTKRLNYEYEFKSAPAGIYQVRVVTTAACRVRSYLSTQPSTQFGVMPSRCMMGADGKNMNSAFVYVPPEAKELKIYNRGVETKVLDSEGKTLVQVKSGKRGSTPVTPGKIYTLKFSKFGCVGFDGFPVILCPDATTAENIRASIEYAPDGTMLHHKWQVRMWEWMHSLKADQLAVKAVVPAKFKEEYKAKPGSPWLFGPDGAFSHADYIFKHQDIDPKSNDYGDSKNYDYLALFYSLDEKFNPYYKNSAVLDRLLLHQYRRLLKLQENGTFHTGWNNYSGGDALSTLSSYTSFSMCGKLMPEGRKNLWENGLGFEIDRFCLSRVSCENQSAHWLVDTYCMYLGGAGELYKDIAAWFAKTAADPELNKFIKTGYMQERYGPDATYQGLNACNLAFYCAMSGDENIKKALSKIYSLYNHTVAPEPDGKVYGASNFSHRTKGSWVHRQWNGGTNLMSGWNEDAACWFDSKGDSDNTRIAKYINWPRGSGDDPWYKGNSKWVNGYVMSPWLPMWYKYFYPVTPVKDAKFPVVREEKFFHEFNGEFYCCREPDYYAVVYAGKTSYDWVKNAYKQDPIGKGWKKDGDTYTPVTAAAKKNGWCPTQGVSLFWTPDYGICIIGKNWDVYTGQFVRADLPGGKVSWPDYWTCKSSYDAASKKLTINNSMFKLPMKTTRTITFLDNGISIDVKLENRSAAKVLKTVEQLPYLKKAGAKVEFFRSGKWTSEAGAATERIRFMNNKDKGALVEFTKPAASSFGPSTKHFKHTVGLVELEITDTLSYKLTEIK